jgi:hypothetical protein
MAEVQNIRIVKDQAGEPYRITDTDAGGDPKYYGFVGVGGLWYIMRKNGEEYRYARGGTDYATNWADRASLLYGILVASI